MDGAVVAVVTWAALVPPTERNGVFFWFDLGPELLGGFIADGPELLLPRLPISGSLTA